MKTTTINTLQEPPSTPSDPDGAADKPLEAADSLKDPEEKLAAAQARQPLKVATACSGWLPSLTISKSDRPANWTILEKYATENLIRQLLTVVDNLERAIASASPDNENGRSVVDGVALTLAEIMKILEKHYVSPIQALGEPFDPTFHQAMCQEESADHPPNTVVQEFQKGYLIHDRLLRPAMVVVSKAAQNGEPTEKTVDTNA